MDRLNAYFTARIDWVNSTFQELIKELEKAPKD